ncbi:hypothetical protein GAY28_37260, partial [Azospirillum brasilense]|nr:hypothetical protein [Azospirillum brasilense]
MLVTLSLPAEDLEWCQREADRLGTTRQEIVAKAAQGYLEEQPTEDLARLRDTLAAKGPGGRKDLARTSAKIPYATHRAIEEIAARRRATKEPGGEITTVYREAVRLAVERALGHQIVEAPKPVVEEAGAPTQSDEAPITAAPEDAGGASDWEIDVRDVVIDFGALPADLDDLFDEAHSEAEEGASGNAEENTSFDPEAIDWSAVDDPEDHPAAPATEAAVEGKEYSWSPEDLAALGIDGADLIEAAPEEGEVSWTPEQLLAL